MDIYNFTSSGGNWYIALACVLAGLAMLFLKKPDEPVGIFEYLIRLFKKNAAVKTRSGESRTIGDIERELDIVGDDGKDPELDQFRTERIAKRMKERGKK